MRPFARGFKLGRNCDNSHKHELLNFYCIGDDSSGTHLGKLRPLFRLFSRWHNGINQNLIFLIGWIHLQHSCRICLLEFFIVFKVKNKRPFVGKYDSYTRMLQMNPHKMLAVLYCKQQSRVIPSRLFIA